MKLGVSNAVHVLSELLAVNANIVLDTGTMAKAKVKAKGVLVQERSPIALGREYI